MPVALNVGDLLIGEGYRLLADATSVAEHNRTADAPLAAEGQRELCRGQGAELLWAQQSRRAQQHAGARDFPQQDRARFRGRAQVGAALRRPARRSRGRLHDYSEALGIAYQIRDDLDDLGDDSAADNNVAIRPSILLAPLRERGKGEVKDIMEALWNWQSRPRARHRPPSAHWAQESARTRSAHAAARKLQRAGHPLPPGRGQRQSERPAPPRDRQDLQRLEIKGWCSEFEVKNGVRDDEGAAPPPVTEDEVSAVAAG